jgi:putative ABC transport system ATP-binding protein
MITVKNVSKIYGKKDNVFRALDDVSFEIPDGASVAIIGKSGSGKSTLMHVVSGLDSATSGSVTIDDQELSKMKKKELDVFRAQKIGFIFQSFFVQGNDTCYDNVSLPLEIADVPLSKRADRVRSALKAVQLEEKIKSKAKNLSGGQKQRLAIARAIVNKPKILFADEPTGNLDTATGEVVEKLLFNYNKQLGATLIIVTHDEDLAAKCDMQIRIQDGKIVDVTGSAKTVKKQGAK